MSEPVKLVCPCCATKLTVDAASGEILAEERPKKDLTQTFQSAMDQVRSGAQRREEAFSKAFDRTKNLDDLLNKKFEEARKKAKEQGNDAGPINPMDLD